MSTLNAFHRTVKFTFEYSNSSVHYLDVNVMVGSDREFITDLYIKPTDTHQFLLASSCHPSHTKRNIAYSQALRICRICSSRALAMSRCDDLEVFLVRRGRSKKKVRKGINKALNTVFHIPINQVVTGASRGRVDFSIASPDPESKRVDTISTVGGPTSDDLSRIQKRIPLVIDYHPALPDITGILRKYQPLLHCSDVLRTAVPELPIVTFRRPFNLGNHLVRAKVSKAVHPPPPLVGPCKKSRCQICPVIQTDNVIKSCVSGHSYRVKCEFANCDTSNIVYVLSCKLCDLQYVGSTVTKFRTRFNNHRSRIRNFNCRNSDDGFRLYEHFSNHQGPLQDCMTVHFLESSDCEESLRFAETQWIWKLKSLFPNGLNVNDGFCRQLSNKRK